MVAPRTPNWRLTADFIVKRAGRTSVTLPAGSYVRPMDLYYVPEHIKDANPYFWESSETYCYTRHGIVAVPNHYLQEA